MTYGPLKRRLGELTAAARTDVPTCTCGGDGLGCRVYCEKKKATAKRIIARDALAAPAPEYVDVTKALIQIADDPDQLACPGPPNCVGGDDHYESCPISQARAPLDALQKALAP